ncbi:MAG: epoxyqueuosine reductase QueH [Oscillospiraceae bacterium]|nr:epoxyqueuosine reductase QueH [Oscillospiraceae bacterium]
MNHNYHKQMAKILPTLDGKPKLLLHSCCGPCSTHVLTELREYFDITLLYYNPNIQPVEEYDLRLAYQRKVLEQMPDIKILECDYDGERYAKAVVGLEDEPEGGKRCSVCYGIRLGETAKIAAEHGFDWFCTTLTVSPRQDSIQINAICRGLEKEYGVRWLPSNFRKNEGYNKSIALAEEMGLYRQEYCGCLYSKNT